MSGSASEAAWHPDPTGRHQHRYWDGAQWTAFVADDGVQSEDPLADAGAGGAAAGVAGAVGDLESVVGRTRARIEMIGGSNRASWRAVRDDDGNDVARLWAERGLSRLCDLSGAPVLTVTMQIRHRAEKEPGPLRVTGAGGEELAAVSFARGPRGTTLTCAHGGARILTIKMREKMTGRLESIVVLDGDERQVGSVEEVDREGRGLSVTSWLVVERDPALVDPVRTLAIAAPVLIDCFKHGANRGPA